MKRNVSNIDIFYTNVYVDRDFLPEVLPDDAAMRSDLKTWLQLAVIWSRFFTTGPTRRRGDAVRHEDVQPAVICLFVKKNCSQLLFVFLAKKNYYCKVWNSQPSAGQVRMLPLHYSTFLRKGMKVFVFVSFCWRKMWRFAPHTQQAGKAGITRASPGGRWRASRFDLKIYKGWNG